MPISDTPNPYLLDLQPAVLLQNDFRDCISPPIASKNPFSSDMSYILACCKRARQKVGRAHHIFELRQNLPQSAKKEILKKKNILTALDRNIACLLEGQEMPKAENKGFIFVNADGSSN